MSTREHRFISSRCKRACNVNLREAYREAAESARETNHEWEHVSKETSQYLGESPELAGQEDPRKSE
jgi:hypothetical protein